MFDIGFFELCVIGVVALLVLGPERLPRAARTAGMWVGRGKRMIAQVKRDIDNEIRQEELQEFQEARETLTKTRESMNSFREDLNKKVESGDGAKSKSRGESQGESQGTTQSDTQSKGPASGTPAPADPEPKKDG